MALASASQASGGSGGLRYKSRHWTVGPMVIVSIALMALLVVVLQRWAFQSPVKWDLTASGINSLSRGTVTFLEGITDEKIRLTSLYFETDLEHEAQKKYRRAVSDLLQLYSSVRPAVIQTEWINPLQEQPRLNEMLQRLRGLPKFEEQSKPYLAHIETFMNEVFPAFKSEVEDLLGELNLAGQTVEGEGASLVAQVHRAVQSWITLGDQVVEDLVALQQSAAVRYSSGTDSIVDLYTQIGERAKAFGTNISPIMSNEAVSGPVHDVLARMVEAFSTWATRFDEQKEQIEQLPPSELENLILAVQSRNVVIVETSKSARAIPFEEMWPPLVEGQFVEDNQFDKRRFAGEGAITPTLLRLVREAKTAVVFVRAGGVKLFGMSGFGMNAQFGPMNNLKSDLEKLNYVVSEWDVTQSDQPPELDEDVQQIVYVITRPQPKPGPQAQMAAPRLEPLQRAAILNAVSTSKRAIFIAGWDASASNFEFDEYLKKQWGIDVNGRSLVINAVPSGPNEWVLDPRGDAFAMTEDIEFEDHPITSNLETLRTVFPYATSLEMTDEKPEDVTITVLGLIPDSEDIWAVKDFRSFAQRYDESRTTQGTPFTRKTSDDISGPFPVLLVAQKDDARICVIGAREEVFIDNVLGMSARIDLSVGRIVTSRRFPGNYVLLTNLLHYMDDTLEWLEVGSPIDQSKIQITDRQLTVCRALVVGVWPAMGLLGGLLVWLIRRR